MNNRIQELDDRMRNIRRKRSTQSAINGLGFSILALFFVVGLLVLLFRYFLYSGVVLYVGIAAVVCMMVGAFFAISNLYDIKTFRANNVAFILAIVTLVVCAIDFDGIRY